MFDLADVLKDVPNLGTTRKELEYLRRNLIDADPNNFYSLDGIDALAANIQLCGLQQPIVVRPAEDGRYVVVSGHRRRAAIELLAAEEPEKWAEVPCLVERDEASPELQQLRLIYANADTRTKSSADLAREAEQVEELLYKLQEQGYEFPGRMRDHVAEAVKASKSKLSRLAMIRKNLNFHFTKLWESGQLRDSVAYTLAKASAEKQLLIWIEQTDNGARSFRCTDGWVETILSEMARMEKLCKQTLCAAHNKDKCSQIRVRIDRAAALSQYSALSCQGCCLDCWHLKDCKFVCPDACASQKALRDKTREERRQKKTEEQAREAPLKEIIRKCYQRVGELRAARGISEKDFIRTSQAYVIERDVKQLPKLEAGTVSLNDRLPGGLWVAEARRLAAVADLLGCSIDYLLGRTDTPEVVPNLDTTGEAGAVPENVPNLGTGWRTCDPDEPGTYAVIGEDPGSPTQMLERWDWDGKQWTVYGEPAKNYGFQVQCWIPLPPKIGTCITGMSGSGRCGAAAYCAEPVECCLQCDKDCNGRCGWIGEDGNG